jgi:hypothetical protein
LQNLQRIRFLLSLMLWLLFIGSVPVSAFGEEVTLEWTPCNVADHYMVSWGTTTRIYTKKSPIILQPEPLTASMSHTITGLTEGETYHFSVQSFNASGASSSYSDEVSITIGSSNSPSTDPDPPSTPIVDTVQPPPAYAGADDIAQTDDTMLVQPTTDSTNASIEILDHNMDHQEWLRIGWDSYTKTSNEARVASGDLDGDGNNELVIGLGPVENDSAIPGGFFQIVSHDYKHLAWGQIPWVEYNDFNGESWPACGDLNGDGVDEIVIGLGKGGEGQVAVFSYNDGIVTLQQWVTLPWNEYNETIGETRPACGNIDSDPCMEIVVGLGSNPNSNTVPNGNYAVFDSSCTGNLTTPFDVNAWGQLDWPEYNALNGETWPSCGNIDGEGWDEILLGLGAGGAGRTEVVTFSENTLTHHTWLTVDWNEYNTQFGETRPACADINGDGTAEIFIGLGPVAGNEQLPDGRFSITDAEQNLNQWEQVGLAAYNQANGESRPAAFKSNGETLVAVGLGPNTAGTKEPPTTGTDDNPSTPPVSAESGGGSSGGCFIDICR